MQNLDAIHDYLRAHSDEIVVQAMKKRCANAGTAANKLRQ